MNIPYNPSFNALNNFINALKSGWDEVETGDYRYINYTFLSVSDKLELNRDMRGLRAKLEELGLEDFDLEVAHDGQIVVYANDISAAIKK